MSVHAALYNNHNHQQQHPQQQQQLPVTGPTTAAIMLPPHLRHSGIPQQPAVYGLPPHWYSHAPLQLQMPSRHPPAAADDGSDSEVDDAALFALLGVDVAPAAAAAAAAAAQPGVTYHPADSWAAVTGHADGDTASVGMREMIAWDRRWLQQQYTGLRNPHLTSSTYYMCILTLMSVFLPSSSSLNQQLACLCLFPYPPSYYCIDGLPSAGCTGRCWRRC